jgi:hypothetical protein
MFARFGVDPRRVDSWRWVNEDRPPGGCRDRRQPLPWSVRGAAEELVEHRDGKGRIAVRGAVDDSFSDQRGTARRDALDLNADLRGDVSGAMRPGSKLGHRPEVGCLCRSDASR